MRTKENQFSKKLREVRGNRSYATMASCLASECKATGSKLHEVEHQKSEPSLKLVIALKEVEGVHPDELLFDGNVPLVNEFNSRYKKVARDAKKLEVFIDRCWALADAAREEMYGYDILNFEEPEEMAHSFSYRLREVREYYGRTVEEVVSLIGCDRSTVYRNEITAEGKEPSMRYIFQFCNGMEVSADYILYGEFLGLRGQSSTILYGLPYDVQLALLNKFIDISAKYF